MAFEEIDISFDFRSDSNGRDPDKYSPTLRRYHQIMWSKALPNGGVLDLDEKLRNHSPVGEFCFASDSIVHAFEYWDFYKHITSQIPRKEMDFFVYQSYTIGSMLIFPANRIENKPTINAARGMHPYIKDRIDLTLECIRLYYDGKESPLFNCLNRYRSFFDLFVSFQGYVNFFMLQDLTSNDGKSVKFLHPFEKFGANILPQNVEGYKQYMQNCLVFVEKRNKRIKENA